MHGQHLSQPDGRGHAQCTAARLGRARALGRSSRPGWRAHGRPGAQVLHEHGVLAHKHQACQVERLMLRRADLILSMEHSHLQRLFRLAPEIRGRAFLIGQWQPTAEIADPYRRAKTAFEQTYVHLSRCVDDWLPYLQSGDPR